MRLILQTFTLFTSAVLLFSGATFSEVEISGASFGDAQTVEEYVREYFQDIPIMAEVARCESQFRHSTKSGSVLRGTVNSKDVGVMQINEHYHLDVANHFKIDIYTLEGNLEYARYLYEDRGVQPWSASKPCWGSKTLARS